MTTAIRRTPRDQAALKRSVRHRRRRARATARRTHRHHDLRRDCDAARLGRARLRAAQGAARWTGRRCSSRPERSGPGLIRIEPVPARPAPRIATVVVEQTLGNCTSAPGLSDTFCCRRRSSPVTLRARVGGAPAPTAPFTFVDPGARRRRFCSRPRCRRASLAAARARWRSDHVGRRADRSRRHAAALRRPADRSAPAHRRATAVFLDDHGGPGPVLVTGAGVLVLRAASVAQAAAPTPFDLLLTTLDDGRGRLARARSDRAPPVRAAARRRSLRARRGPRCGRSGITWPRGVGELPRGCSGVTNGCSAASSPTPISTCCTSRCTR